MPQPLVLASSGLAPAVTPSLYFWRRPILKSFLMSVKAQFHRVNFTGQEGIKLTSKITKAQRVGG
jgi:hypothetical protein